MFAKMSDLSKIPFGLRVADDAIVDVCEVPNGKQCGCICPSCRMPLQAKQGQLNRWYFAHDSKHAQEETKIVCDYSFYPSVRLMAKQVFSNSFQLSLPGLMGKIEYYQGVRWVVEHNTFNVSDPKIVVMENIVMDATFCGNSVDIVGTIKDFQFVIFFSQPDRTVPDNLFEPENPKCGILEINLSALHNAFIQKQSQHQTYREILTDFLQHDLVSKKWIYHPRFKQRSNEAIEQLKRLSNILDCSVVQLNGISRLEPKTVILPNQPPCTVNRIVRFECVMCHVQWEGSVAGGNCCPKCQNHLYSKIIE